MNWPSRMFIYIFMSAYGNKLDRWRSIPHILSWLFVVFVYWLICETVYLSNSVIFFLRFYLFFFLEWAWSRTGAYMRLYFSRNATFLGAQLEFYTKRDYISYGRFRVINRGKKIRSEWNAKTCAVPHQTALRTVSINAVIPLYSILYSCKAYTHARKIRR